MTGSTTAGPTGSGAADRRRAQALAVLGLPAAATPAEITRRFRELVKATHPDTSPGSEALEEQRAGASNAGTDMRRRMTAICDAYHLLSGTPDDQRTPAASPAPSPVPVPVHRRDSPRAAARQPWVVAGPVRVQPWPGEASSPRGHDSPDGRPPR